MTFPRLHHEIEAMLRCALLVLGVVACGTLGFHLVEKEWSLWQSFYFTIVTITTVGYGDYGLSPTGELVSAVLMVCGLGVFTYSLTTIVRIASDSEAARRRKMNRDIHKMHDHIIICGYGRMGRSIASELRRGGLECVVIEQSEHGVAQAMHDDVLVLEGEASDDEFLIEAGLQRARGVVCAVDTDAENMYITLTARDMNPDCTIISRAESEAASRKIKRAGATLVVSPHQMAGETAATAIMHPRLSRFLGSNADGSRSFELGEAEVVPGCDLSGQSIIEFGAQAPDLVFVAIERASGELIVRPRGNEVFQDSDVVIFAGSDADTSLIRHAATCGALSV